MAAEGAPRWFLTLQYVGMFLLGAGLLFYEAVLRMGEYRPMLCLGYFAMMCGPVVLASWLARK